MLLPLITSRQHPVCKLVRSLHEGKGRRKSGLFLVEGGMGVREALRARWPLERLLASPDDLEAGWGELAGQAGVEVQPVAPDLLESLSDAQTAPDVLALAKLPLSAPPDWNLRGLLLLLDGIGDPGNTGTLLRAGDAVGCEAAILSEGSADAFAPKAVRSSAGSVFHLPPLSVPDRSTTTLARELQSRDIPIIAASAHGGQSAFDFAWPPRCALVLGHETRGLSPALEAAAQARVTIPIFGHAESLNVAMAGTVLLYAWRQAQ